jgi:hypothetical protein
MILKIEFGCGIVVQILQILAAYKYLKERAPLRAEYKSCSSPLLSHMPISTININQKNPRRPKVIAVPLPQILEGFLAAAKFPP